MKRYSFLLLGVLLFSSKLISSGGGIKSSGKESVPAPPPLPRITALALEPAALTLHDARDARRVLVWGQTQSGERIDLTDRTTFRADSNVLEVVDGYLTPRAGGETEVSITAAGLSAKLPVKILGAEKGAVRFVRDIEPILSKVGCNAGTCHGSAKGKNGFKLSLRGYDPDFDYQALINDLSGRRFNRVAVDESLMLLKPIADVPHEGRQAIIPGSPEYEMLRQWIAQGTPFEDPDHNRAKMLVVLPDDIELDLPGRTQQMIVMAEYSDGTARDVTREVVFSTSNKDVLEVKDGLISALRRGEAAVLMRYEGLYATKEVKIGRAHV